MRTHLTKILTVGAAACGLAMLAPNAADAQKKGPTFDGAALSAGGGVTAFSDDDTNDMVDTGGTWEVRGVIGTRSMIGLEAAYIGSYQGLDMEGLRDEQLLGNGLEGNVRLNIGTFDVQPYVVGGLGWTHYDVVEDDFDEVDVNMQPDDEVVTVPAGAGISLRPVENLIVDLRGTYRFAFDEELIEDDDTVDFTDRESLDTWTATARLGYEF